MRLLEFSILKNRKVLSNLWTKDNRKINEENIFDNYILILTCWLLLRPIISTLTVIPSLVITSISWILLTITSCWSVVSWVISRWRITSIAVWRLLITSVITHWSLNTTGRLRITGVVVSTLVIAISSYIRIEGTSRRYRGAWIVVWGRCTWLRMSIVAVVFIVKVACVINRYFSNWNAKYYAFQGFLWLKIDDAGQNWELFLDCYENNLANIIALASRLLESDRRVTSLEIE